MNTKTKYSLLSASIMVLGAAAAPAAYAQCLGANTFNCIGGAFANSCTGTSGADFIICDIGLSCRMNGLGGNDFLVSLGGGNDRACGGSGSDFIVLGNGSDIGNGEGGADGVVTGIGDDLAFGGTTADGDALDGGPGTDVLDGGPGTPNVCTNGETTANCDFEF